jgi:hypothetical protein
MFDKATRHLGCVGIIVAAALAFFTVSNARALTILQNGNSSVSVNVNSSDPAAPYISSWVVDGVDQYSGGLLPGEYFAIAVGANVGFGGLQLGSPSSMSASNGSFSATYLGTGWSLAVKDVLSGGTAGSGDSHFSEQFTFTNTGTSSLPYMLLDEVALNVDGTPGNNTLTLSPNTQTNTAKQTGPLGTLVTIKVTPPPATVFTESRDTMTSSSSLGPISGDPEFTFGWNNTVAAGDSEQISVDETVTSPGSTGGVTVPLPNPAAIALVGLAGLGALGIVRRIRQMAI